jgi:predicted metal-dependent peptidase
MNPEEYERKALDLLARARIYVKKKGPYFTRLIYSLVPVPVPNLGTIAVTDTMIFLYDPVRLVDDPEFSTLDSDGLPRKLAGGLVHEAMHILRNMDRIKELATIDMQIANMAADIPINDDLVDAEWELPSWAIFSRSYGLPRHESMEFYFQELMKNAQKNKDKQKPDVCAGQCGSVAGNDGGQGSDLAQAEAAANASGVGRTEAEKENTKRITASEAKKHFQGGAGRGTAPGWVEELLNSTKKKKERNWEKDLKHVVRRTTGLALSGGSDFSMARQSKRSILLGIPRPGLIDQKAEIAMFWDTSGSMGTKELEKCVQVTYEVLAQMGIDHVLLAQGDTQIVKDFQRTSLRDLKNIKAHGRGGTDFRPVFERLKKLRPKPNVIMIVTDGGGPAPERAPPGVPVIWVIVPSSWRMRPTKWGHYVICSNDDGVVEEFDSP